MSEAATSISATGEPKPDRNYLVAALALLGIGVIFAVGVATIHPTAFFGLTEDDAIYFSSARALATGHGYVLESLPGSPPASKYPVLYPWLLSWIWRWQPNFPANLKYAVAMNVAFGFVYIVGSYFLLQNLTKLNEYERLALVAFCALHPVVIFHAANLLSDLPFAAVVSTAMALAGWSVRKEDNRWLPFLSGFFSGTSILLRVLGLPIAAGLALAMVCQRKWRNLGLFILGVAPFGVIWLLVSSSPRALSGPVDGSLCADIWRTNWLYYTSYLDFWRIDELQNRAFWQSLKQSSVLLFLQPGSYLVEPGRMPGLLTSVPAFVLSVATLVGWRKWMREKQLSGLTLALGLYAVPVLIWDYPAVSRFLIPFLPLLVAGVWLETRSICARVIAIVRTHGLRKEGPAIVFLVVAISTLALATGHSYWDGHRDLIQQGQRRASLGLEKREAYDWLRENTPLPATVVAYEDSSLYLYSGHRAMRPIIFLPAGRFDPALLQTELKCISESSKRIRAEYWLVSDDDFGFEWQPASSSGSRQEDESVRDLRLVFRSRGSSVRIYSVDSQPGLRPVVPNSSTRDSSPRYQ